MTSTAAVIDTNTGEILNAPLTTAEAQQLAAHEATIRAGRDTFVAVGTALLAIRDARLYRAEFDTFEDYCQVQWDMSRQFANKLIGAAGVVVSLETIVSKEALPTNEAQARALLRFPEDLRPAIAQTAAATASALNKPMTAGLIERTGDVLVQAATTGVVDVNGEATPLIAALSETEYEATQRRNEYMRNGKGTPAALQMSESNEWYTPAAYIEAARSVMGGIDLDPASCEFANQTVKAARFFSIDDNGLRQAWRGRVWLNPPYGRDVGESNQGLWSARLIEQYRAGNVTQAVLLVNAVTDREWFAPLWDFPICFASKRIRFYNEAGEPGQPTHGNALIYLGANRERFVEVFKQFGACVVQVVR